MKKETFRQIEQQVPQPEKLTLSTQLPSFFDMMWDAKTFKELLYRVGSPPPSHVLRCLREYGFDTNVLPKTMALLTDDELESEVLRFGRLLTDEERERVAGVVIPAGTPPEKEQKMIMDALYGRSNKG